MSIKTRLSKLEQRSGVNKAYKHPLIIKIDRETDFSPKEIALLQADDNRIMQDIKSVQYSSPLAVLSWNKERLAGLRRRA